MWELGLNEPFKRSIIVTSSKRNSENGVTYHFRKKLCEQTDLQHLKSQFFSEKASTHSP